MIEAVEVSCPHCGSINLVELDYSAAARQQFIEDCYICCRPIEYLIHIDGEGGVSVDAEKAY